MPRRVIACELTITTEKSPPFFGYSWADKYYLTLLLQPSNEAGLLEFYIPNFCLIVKITPILFFSEGVNTHNFYLGRPLLFGSFVEKLIKAPFLLSGCLLPMRNLSVKFYVSSYF